EKARALLEPLAERVKDARSPASVERAAVLLNLAGVYWALGRPEQTVRLSGESLTLLNDYYGRLAPGLPEPQHLAVTHPLRNHLDSHLSLPRGERDPAAPAYAHALGWKGAVFALQQAQRDRRVLLSGERGKEAAALYDELQTASRRLAAAALSRP